MAEHRIRPGHTAGAPQTASARTRGTFSGQEDRPICGPRTTTMRGYFLVACRALGHDVSGIDPDTTPLYNELFELFELPRTVHCVTSDEPERPAPFSA